MQLRIKFVYFLGRAVQRGPAHNQVLWTEYPDDADNIDGNVVYSGTLTLQQQKQRQLQQQQQQQQQRQRQIRRSGSYPSQARYDTMDARPIYQDEDGDDIVFNESDFRVMSPSRDQGTFDRQYPARARSRERQVHHRRSDMHGGLRVQVQSSPQVHPTALLIL